MGSWNRKKLSRVQLCDPMDGSTPGFPVRHQLLECAQTHVYPVGDANQPSHPLSSPSPSTCNLSQYQGLFQWVGSLHQVAKVLSFSFSISPSNEYSGLISLGWTDWISLQSKRLSGVLCSTTIQKNHLFGVQPSLWSNSHIRTWLMEKPYLWLYTALSAKWCLCFWIHYLGLS